MYFNYKGYYSVVLQGISDANYKFIAIEVRAYGKQSDAGTFSDLNVYQRLEANTLNIPENENIPLTNISAPFVLLGDDAYPLKTNLLKPYSRKRLTIEERIFNYRLSRARRCVECAFGILVAKWRCLKTELQIDPNKIDIVVKCVCLLHNIIIDK
ncbi:protein ALP1-like [Rhopalosiphum maidis]|uniref:protein ALP1-like n=1 Tax=Rhopalosiphum maidis TaxID=43146 RepID=UPI000F00B728|nr:protein ALP1-like [Rhopalosiphum maidis]